MAITYYAFVTACLFLSQMQHSCHSRDLLPDYITEVMVTLVNPTLIRILKLQQIKRLANDKSLTHKKEGKQKEYCDILNDELALEGTSFQRAYDIDGKLVGYMAMFTAESSKCEKENFPLNKLSCYLKVGKTVAYVYGLHEKTAKHALSQMENIDRYVSRLAEKCFHDATDLL